MRGDEPAISLQNLANFQVHNAEAARQFEQMYESAADPVMQATGRETFEAVAMLQAVRKQPYSPAGGADYPRSSFGDSLKQIAQLIKAEVGMEMAFADIGGWDHHVNETGPRASQGQLANLLGQYGQALWAFWTDMGDRMADVALVTMSEFGRTAHENGNRSRARQLHVRDGRRRQGRQGLR
jgi:uncharacterized protein (DUF1501 family)